MVFVKVKLKIAAAFVFFLVILFAFYSALSSKSISSGRLFALKLDSPPDETDWNNALPLIVTAQNGNLHELKKSVDIDEDTVHTTSKSCHHGPPAPPPVKILLKAYYTDEELFLRISWDDKTKDDKMYEFTYDNDKWNVSEKLEDGLGIMWDLSAGVKPFNCSYACHTTKWRLKDSSLISSYKMGTLDDNMVDIWNWKAFRTNTLDFADDKYIDKTGITPDTFSKIYFYNSNLRKIAPLDYSASKITPMEDGDTPVYDGNGLLITDRYWMVSGRAPGIRVSVPSGSRADIKASAGYGCGSWEVTLRRKLLTNDNKDVAFDLNKNNVYKFGVAVMDNTLINHFAVPDTLELVFKQPPDLM
jgi:hypothetical protein